MSDEELVMKIISSEPEDMKNILEDIDKNKLPEILSKVQKKLELHIKEEIESEIIGQIETNLS